VIITGDDGEVCSSLQEVQKKMPMQQRKREKNRNVNLFIRKSCLNKIDLEGSNARKQYYVPKKGKKVKGGEI